MIVYASSTRTTNKPTSLSAESFQTIDGVDFKSIRATAFTGNSLARLKSTVGFAIRMLASLWRRPVQCGKPDIIIGSSPDPLVALAARLLAARHRVPFVLEIRDIWPASLTEVANVSPRHPYVLFLARLENFLYRRSRGIVGLLEGVDLRVAEVAGTSHSRKVIWIPNGCAVHERPTTRVDAEKPYFDLVYTGAHGVPNALHTVIEAADLIARKGSRSADGRPYRFRFYGDGVCKKELVDEVDRRKIPNVEFHDPVPKAEVRYLLEQADAVLLPGLDTDLYRYGASPNKMFDYMASGRPIVTSLRMLNNPVEKAACGVIVEPEDPDALCEAIVDLAQETDETRAAIGERGQMYLASHHEPHLLARRFKTYLDEILTETRRPSD